MRLLLLYINFLICFSALLDEIRKEVVDKALLKLPKRESIDILKMAIEMSKAKEDYSMTDAESAYFAYKWIGQNIENDCLGNGTTLPANIYKDGKGGEDGISSLFNMICEFLSIETNTILGIKKIYTRDFTEKFTKLLRFDKYSWNYISIDDKYYLVDIASNTGECQGTELVKTQNDDYFAIEPELCIRNLFPNDEEWQLLKKPITEDQFKSQAILENNFFKYFKNLSPDTQIIKKETKLQFTAKDTKIEKLYFRQSYEIKFFKEYTVVVNRGQEIEMKDGIFEYTMAPFDSGYGYIEVSEDDKKYYRVASYVVNLPEDY